MLARRLFATLFVAALGCGVSWLFGARDWPGSQPYLLIATALLAVGLFSATHDISIPELSGSVRLVFIAVTFGVVVKAAIIAGVMYAIFRDPAFLVLGVAVAQIDPLSVAVMHHRSRMSKRAKAILAAWSSFDDPVTAILAVYLSAVALGLSQSTGNGSHDLMGGYSSVGANVLLNALLVVGAYAVWRILRALGDRDRRGTEPQSWPVWLRVLAVGVLLAAGVIAVGWFLMLGIALVGLFLHPGIDRTLSVVTPVAFIVAVFMLGMVLANGVNLLPGVLLGVSAFAAQVIVGLIVTRSLDRDDRLRLALSQQNGITAIILALLLETIFPGTVAIVGPAILVVGVLHMGSNAVLDSIEDSGWAPRVAWAALISRLGGWVRTSVQGFAQAAQKPPHKWLAPQLRAETISPRSTPAYCYGWRRTAVFVPDADPPPRLVPAPTAARMPLPGLNGTSNGTVSAPRAMAFEQPLREPHPAKADLSPLATKAAQVNDLGQLVGNRLQDFPHHVPD